MGMAHSGTTIVAKVLSQCPDFALCVHGKQSWLLEHDAILGRNTAQVAALLIKHPKKRILLKKPWCEKNGEWFAQELPNAYYLCVLKEKNQVMQSWSKPGSFVNTEFRKNPVMQSKQYDEFREMAEKFPCKKSLIIKFNDLIARPKKSFATIATFLDVNYIFDTSEVGKGNVKRSLSQK